MRCPHCGFEAPTAAGTCPSCGYLLAPPERPRASGLRWLGVLAALVVFALLFITAVRAITSRSPSMISFFGPRSAYDLAAGPVVLAPGEARSFELRNPARTPICRLYGGVYAASPGATLLVLDSLEFTRLQAGLSFHALSTTPIAGDTDIDGQTDGGDVLHHIVFRNPSADTLHLTLHRLQAFCYQRW